MKYEPQMRDGMTKNNMKGNVRRTRETGVEVMNNTYSELTDTWMMKMSVYEMNIKYETLTETPVQGRKDKGEMLKARDMV